MRKFAIAFLILAGCGFGSLWFPPPEPASACATGTGCSALENTGCGGSACYTGLIRLIVG